MPHRFSLESRALSPQDGALLNGTILSFTRGVDPNIHLYAELFRRNAAPMTMEVNKTTIDLVGGEALRRAALPVPRHTDITDMDIEQIAMENIAFVAKEVNGQGKYQQLSDHALYAGIVSACIDRDFYYTFEHTQPFTPMPPTKTTDFFLSFPPKKTAIPQLNEGFEKVATYLQTVSYTDFATDLHSVPDTLFGSEPADSGYTGIIEMLDRLIQKHGETTQKKSTLIIPALFT